MITDDGTQLGILPTHEALRLAEERGLDLVEVSPKAMPPVCRVMDYGRFKYEKTKKDKAAKKHQSTVMLKEVKFRPKTDEHDRDFKKRAVERFLAEGNRVKLVVMFRGREIVHPETGKAVLDRVLRALGDSFQVDQAALMEGRRMTMVISPRVGVIRRPPRPGEAAAPAPARAAGQNPPPAAARTPATPPEGGPNGVAG